MNWDQRIDWLINVQAPALSPVLILYCIYLCFSIYWDIKNMIIDHQHKLNKKPK